MVSYNVRSARDLFGAGTDMQRQPFLLTCTAGSIALFKLIHAQSQAGCGRGGGGGGGGGGDRVGQLPELRSGVRCLRAEDVCTDHIQSSRKRLPDLGVAGAGKRAEVKGAGVDGMEVEGVYGKVAVA